MDLYLLEVTYAAEDRQLVEPWLSQVHPKAVLLSVEQYDDEILAVLVSQQSLIEVHKKLQRHSAISSCESKRRALYRVTTSIEPAHVLCTFPFRAGEEWYLGPGKTTYLSAQSHQLREEQLSWLNNHTEIVTWEDAFDLIPMLVG